MITELWILVSTKEGRKGGREGKNGKVSYKSYLDFVYVRVLCVNVINVLLSSQNEMLLFYFWKGLGLACNSGLGQVLESVTYRLFAGWKL